MSSPFADSIREQLVAVAYREQRRRRFRIGGLITSAAAALSTALVVLLPSPAAAHVEVTISDGFVEVRITDLRTDPQEVLDALHQHEIEADVTGVATGPSNVGQFVQLGIAGGEGDLERLGDTGSAFRGFRVREGWTGVLTIGVGEQASGDEFYDATTDAVAPGEPLDCAGVFGRPIAEAAEQLDDYQVDVHVSDDGLLGERLSLSDAVESHGAWTVTRAVGRSSTVLVLDIEDDPPQAEPDC